MSVIVIGSSRRAWDGEVVDWPHWSVDPGQSLARTVCMDTDRTTTVAIIDPNWGAGGWWGQFRAEMESRGYLVWEPAPTGWVGLSKEDEHRVYLYHAGSTQDGKWCELLADLNEDAVIGATMRLGWWHRLTGVHYHGTPGLSCLDRLRASLPNRDGHTPHRMVDRPEIDGHGPLRAGHELVWQTRRKSPRTGYRWDMRSAYLAAASAADLGWGPPRPTGTDPEDGAPGWYRIILGTPPEVADGVPVIDRRDIGRDGTTWVTLPMIKFLREIGHPFEIIDSYTSRTGGRLLRTWAEAWRDVLTMVPSNHGGHGIVKRGYVQAIGLLGRPGGLIHRPDWHDTIRTQARVSLLRRIDRVHSNTTLSPVEVNTDAVYYSSRLSPDEIHEINVYIGIGERIGNMRYEGQYSKGVKVR